jgi:hypothetical protein
VGVGQCSIPSTLQSNGVDALLMAVGSQPTLSEAVWWTLGVAQHGLQPFIIDLESMHFTYSILECGYEFGQNWNSLPLVLRLSWLVLN